MRQLLLVAVLAAVMAVASAGAAFAGEITGNGKSLKNADGTLNGHSACAFSGQEDLQWFEDDANTIPIPEEDFERGKPGHAQSWGQVPKAVRDAFPAEMHPGNSCNPTGAGGE